MTNNKIDLTDGGQLHLREARSNGLSAVKVQAPNALSADFSLTLPGSATGTAPRPLMMTSAGVLAESAVEFDIDGLTLPGGTEFLRIDASGNLTTTSGAGANSLDLAYDQGGAGAGRAITVDGGAVQLDGDADNTVLDINQTTAATANVLEVQNSGTGDAVEINQDADGVALDVNKTDTGSAVLISLQNSGSGNDITADNWSAAQDGTITSEKGVVALTQAGDALTITTATNSTNAIDLTHSGIGPGVRLVNDATNAAAFAVDIQQNTDVAALVVTKTNTGSTNLAVLNNSGTGDGLSVNQNGNGIAMDINKTNTGSANVLEVQNSGTGDAVEINQDADGVALDVNKTDTGTATVVDIANGGTGIGLRLQSTNTDSSAACLEIVNNSTGAAIDVDVGQASEGVQISGAVANNKTLVVTATNLGGPMVELNNNNALASIALQINQSNTSSSAPALDVSGGDTRLDKFLALTLSSETISSGAITPTTSFVVVTEEGGVPDNLDTINGGVDGRVLILLGGGVSEAITLREVGNIIVRGGSTYTLSEAAILVYHSSSSKWFQI